MLKVIFVCTGGTCRSPMAEHILKHKLKTLGYTAKQCVVASAGIEAAVGETINPNSVAALKQIKINVKPTQKARQLNRKMVNRNTIFIAISSKHKEWIKNLGEVYAFSDFDGVCDIADPYGMNVEHYVETMHQISHGIDVIFEQLIKNKL